MSLTGCTHALHQYHAGDVEPVRKKANARRVIAKTEQFVVLGFVYDTNYVNEAFSQLEDQCKNGSVTGIHTRYSTSHGFFSWTNKVKMTGTCIR